METIYRYMRNAEPFMRFAWSVGLALGLFWYFTPQVNAKLPFAYLMLGLFIAEIALSQLKPLEYDFSEYPKGSMPVRSFFAFFICPKVAGTGTGVFCLGIFNFYIGRPASDLFTISLVVLLIAELHFFLVGFWDELVRKNYSLRIRYWFIVVGFIVFLILHY